MSKEYFVDFPFRKGMHHGYDADGPFEESTWIPGCDAENNYDDFDLVADGMGKMVLTEISRHKPGKYPERVFYVREWIDPQGFRFGKKKLRITAASNFKKLAGGYQQKFTMRESFSHD